VRPRRVVTGRDADGNAVFVSDGELPRFVAREAIPGMEDGVVWATEAAAAAPRDGADPTAAVTSVVPAPGATRFLTVTLPPESALAAAELDPAAIAAENAAVVPGLAERFEPDDPAMHVTPTVDYVVVLEGELWLDLGEGRETLVRRGDLVVQNATRHAWRNRGSGPATIATVFVGVETDAEGDGEEGGG
jgi:mannose-6-phosphate isomerase-like protein (cupin superfamily)